MLCELVPGGVPEEITADRAARLLGSLAPPGAVAAASRDRFAAYNGTDPVEVASLAEGKNPQGGLNGGQADGAVNLTGP